MKRCSVCVVKVNFLTPTEKCLIVDFIYVRVFKF